MTDIPEWANYEAIYVGMCVRDMTSIAKMEEAISRALVKAYVKGFNDGYNNRGKAREK